MVEAGLSAGESIIDRLGIGDLYTVHELIPA